MVSWLLLVMLLYVGKNQLLTHAWAPIPPCCLLP